MLAANIFWFEQRKQKHGPRHVILNTTELRRRQLSVVLGFEFGSGSSSITG